MGAAADRPAPRGSCTDAAGTPASSRCAGIPSSGRRECVQICNPPVSGRFAAPGCDPAESTPLVGVATGKIRRHDQQQSGLRAPSARESPARMSLVKEPPAYRTLRTALAVGAALLGSGCDLSHAPMLDPKGPIALAERDLLFTAVVLMLIVVIPVFVMTFLFAWRYRSSNSNARYTPNWSYSVAIDAVVWLVPALIVIALGALLVEQHAQARSLQTDRRRQSRRSRSRWSRRTGSGCSSIPEQGIAVVNQLVFPSRTPLSLRITSDTVMNSFYHPGLGRPDLRHGRDADAAASAGRRARAVRRPQHPIQRRRLFRPALRGDRHVAGRVRRLGGEGQAIAGQAGCRQPTARSPRPASGHPVTYYSAVEPDLFDTIIAKYTHGRRTPISQPAE